MKGNNIENIIYKELGNRVRTAEVTLKLAEQECRKIGINHFHDVSDLIFSPFKIYSCKRIYSENHFLYGGSLQSLGKGENQTQSKISCLMEALETYYAEKIPDNLIKGSFNNLKRKHLVVDPRKIIHLCEKNAICENEELMWAKVFHPHLESEILILADLIYFPFLAESYGTNSYFNPSSNGVASGNNFTEAVIHGLYEIIERGVLSECDLGFGIRREIDLKKNLDEELFSSLLKTHNLKINFLDSFNLKGFPVFEATVELDGKIGVGHGCDLNVKTAMKRAITESLQSLTVFFSKDREDFILSKINRHVLFNHSVKETIFNPMGSFLAKRFEIKNDQLCSPDNFINYNFKTVEEELLQINYLLKDSGHNDYYIANFTPSEFPFEIIKIISPSILSKISFYHISRYENSNLNRIKSFKYNLP